MGKEQLNITLEELRRLYDITNKNANTLDTKASGFLSSSSIILTLFGLLIKDRIIAGSLCDSQKNFMWAIFIVFILMIILLFFTLNPRTFLTPIGAKENKVEEFLNKEKNSMKSTLIANYIFSIKNNETINQTKMWFIRVVTFLYVLMLGMVVYLTLIFL